MDLSARETAGADQVRYARVLAWGAHAGLAVLVLVFAAYAAGIASPVVPLERLPELWSAPASEYLRQSGIAAGWDWIRFVGHPDILSLAGIAALAFCSVPCVAAIMPIYWADRQRALFAICALEIAVLFYAASGLPAVAW